MPLVTGFPVGWSPSKCNSLEDVDRELIRVRQAMQESAVQYLALVTWNTVPARPFTGMTVLADGVNWNPGGGQGVYTYYAAAWNRLG